MRDGAFGSKSLDQIRNVYRECCRMRGSGDEVWLYGFSRGAYVVRAVAGLLHYIRVLTSADESDAVFNKDYKAAVKVYSAMQRTRTLGDGQVRTICQFLSCEGCKLVRSTAGLLIPSVVYSRFITC